ncbi:MAG TPA: ABC transporter substrate-binding protein [Jatrophihabitantaceae bacterium]|jgi:iron(III) transport system substrate-binding protein
MLASRRSRAVLGLVAVGLAAAACSSSKTNSKGSSQLTQSLSREQLAAAAAKEGSLTWYTTFAADDVASMTKAFNKVYPQVSVKTLRLSADKIPARVSTEQRGGKYNADVISGNSSYVAQLIQTGALQPYSPPDAAPLPAGLDMPTGYDTYTYVTTTALAYNPTVLRQDGLPIPHTLQDLTKPVYKGKFSIDPGAVNIYDSTVKSIGADAAKKLFTDLGNNDPRFVESHTEAVTDVEAGEPPVAATAYGYKAASEKRKSPRNIDFVNPNPLPTGVDLLDIAKNAPHPNAARLFVDWLSSQAGQQSVVDITNHTSLRSDVDNDKTVWNPATWPPVYSNPNLPSATFNEYLADMKQALHAP